jgi:hypothetical protein
MMKRPLIESECSRPEFGGGEPIRMADGQPWFVFSPAARVIPMMSPSGIVRVAQFSFGRAWDSANPLTVAQYVRALDRVVALFPGDSTGDRRGFMAHYRAVIALGEILIQRNYALDRLEAWRLLAADVPDDPEAAVQRFLRLCNTGITEPLARLNKLTARLRERTHGAPLGRL